MRRAIVATTIFAGCASLPVHTDGQHTPEQIDGIESAWRVRVELVDDPACAVVLHQNGPDERVDCIGKDAAGCAAGRDIWCPPDLGIACAHEVGHVATLQHVDSSTNVMAPAVGKHNTEVEPAQVKRVRALAGVLNACRKATQ